MGRRAIGRLAPPPAARGEGIKTQRGKKKRPQSGAFWRRGRDSNPRKAKHLYTLSRRATSTTHPPLRWRSTDYSRIGPQKARGGALGRFDFPVWARTAQNGKEPKAGRGARRSKSPLGARRLGRKRRVGSPSHPLARGHAHAGSAMLTPCSRHAHALLSFSLSGSPPALSLARLRRAL